MRLFLSLFTVLCSFSAPAEEKACTVEKAHEAVIAKLFSGAEHLYSVLWWSDPSSEVINARSFVINGRDSIPIFSSEAEGRSQLAGSGLEKELVGIEPKLLAGVLQKMEYAILNPGGVRPVQFRTCILKKYL